MDCNTMDCNTMDCNTMDCNAMDCNTMDCNKDNPNINIQIATFTENPENCCAKDNYNNQTFDANCANINSINIQAKDDDCVADCFIEKKFKYTQPIFIVGATASGKSELAFRVAKKFDGVIISADSMQIYRGLDIGTAKESVARQAEIEYKMLDIVNFDQTYSVAEYATAAKKCIDDALKSNKLPIVVGGTGLYFEALIYPMSFANAPKNDTLRTKLNEELETYGKKYMHDKLASVDSESAEKLHENDTKRVIRALEIVLTTGKTRRENSDNAFMPDVIMIGLNTERAALYEKINKRVDVMFENGLIQEVAKVIQFSNRRSPLQSQMPQLDCKTQQIQPPASQLNCENCRQNDHTLQQGVYPFDLQSMQAIGYKEFGNAQFEIIDGTIIFNANTLSDIKDKIKQDTRNYAKRQITWFKKYPFVKWFDSNSLDDAESYIIKQLT